MKYYAPVNNYEAYKRLPFDQKAPHYYHVERGRDYGHGETFQVWARNRIGQGWSIARYTDEWTANSVANFLNNQSYKKSDV